MKKWTYVRTYRNGRFLLIPSTAFGTLKRVGFWTILELVTDPKSLKSKRGLQCRGARATLTEAMHVCAEK